MMAASKAMKQRAAEETLSHVQSRSLSLTAILESNQPPSDLESNEISFLHLQAEREVANFRRQDIDPLFEHTVYNPLEALRNALRGAASPLRRFPSETVSEIFAQCLSYHPKHELFWNRLDTTDAPWTLTRVCRRWRAIALADQRLWSSIEVDSWSMAANGQPQPTLRILSTCLERSGGHALSISYTDRYPSTYGSQPLFLHLMRYAHRWTHLFLHASFRFLQVTASLQGRLPELHVLSVATSGPNDATTTLDGFMAAPKLRDVSISTRSCTVNISKFVPNGIRLPWDQLTSIETDSFDILPFLPQLIHCDVRIAKPHALQKTVRHENLRTLRLERDVESTINWLELPSLISLDYFSVKFSDEVTLKPVRSLIHRSSCRLQTLSLGHISTFDLEGLIESTPDLKSFTLADGPSTHDWSIVWAVLTPTPELVLAPKLEHITLHITERLGWNSNTDVESLVALLEFRRCRMVDNDDTRCLKSVTIHGIILQPAPHLTQRLARLRENGLKMMLG